MSFQREDSVSQGLVEGASTWEEGDQIHLITAAIDQQVIFPQEVLLSNLC